MAHESSAYEEMARLLATGIEPVVLINYMMPQHLTDYYVQLVEKEKNGQISDAEKKDLDQLLMMNHVISMAKLMAVRKLEAA